MDLLSLVTSSVDNNEVGGPEEDLLGVIEGWQDDETHNPDVPAVSCKRGLTPFVFVPFAGRTDLPSTCRIFTWTLMLQIVVVDREQSEFEPSVCLTLTWRLRPVNSPVFQFFDLNAYSLAIIKVLLVLQQ
ncbi:hypothetical protein SLEP1_g45701 [Rubroshorea leprosula]|uniref:F-box protein Hrt3/FBXO9 C-terminal domain-containing protein n=1 Tax=Rubroshorea leprosula TaxID=152421 RepID=A0AAV5LLN6_9ROSI|nr:hypothetical protein SLEP1_g45701 [Rubroshorea leprosula]